LKFSVGIWQRGRVGRKNIKTKQEIKEKQKSRKREGTTETHYKTSEWWWRWW
jgi:hypothetical protein